MVILRERCLGEVCSIGEGYQEWVMDVDVARWVRLVSEDTLYDERTIERALEMTDDYYHPRDAL